MNIKFTKEQKKYLELVEELKDLCCKGYVGDFYYPDMGELCDSLYDYVLTGLGIYKGVEPPITCNLSLEGLESIVKEGRERKAADMKGKD